MALDMPELPLTEFPEFCYNHAYSIVTGNSLPVTHSLCRIHISYTENMNSSMK